MVSTIYTDEKLAWLTSVENRPVCSTRMIYIDTSFNSFMYYLEDERLASTSCDGRGQAKYGYAIPPPYMKTSEKVGASKTFVWTL